MLLHKAPELDSRAKRIGVSPLNVYETDEEKAEAIKAWWKENGLSVAAGIALGLGAVFGWRAWMSYQDRIAQQASAAFEQLIATAQSGEVEQVQAQADQIDREFPNTTYAALAAWVRGRAEVDAQRLPEAQAALRLALDRAPDPSLKRLTALRLARLLIAEQAWEEAAAVLERYEDDGPFRPEFDALRGDLVAASGQIQQARAAYQRAIEGGAIQANLLQEKRDDLPPSS